MSGQRQDTSWKFIVKSKASYLPQLKGHRDSHVDGWSFIRFTTVTNVLCKSESDGAHPYGPTSQSKEETWERFLKCLMKTRCVTLAYDIRKQQVPPSDEGQKLSHRHVAVKVRRARFGNPGPKLRVAQSREYGRHGGDEEGDDNAGSSGLPGHLSGQDVDPRPQGAAHPEGHQVQGAQASVKGGLLALGIQGLPPREALQEGLERIDRHAPEAGRKGVGRWDRWECGGCGWRSRCTRRKSEWSDTGGAGKKGWIRRSVNNCQAGQTKVWQEKKKSS